MRLKVRFYDNWVFFGMPDNIYVIGLPLGYFWLPCVYNFTAILWPKIIQMPRFIHTHETTHTSVYTLSGQK